MTTRSGRHTCNIRYRLSLVLAVLFTGAPVHADLVAFEVGRGNHNTRGSDAWFVRYQHDIKPLWGGMSFIEFNGGAWNGHYENRTVGGTGGLRYALTKQSYFSAAAGLAYVTDRTDHLGTHPQIPWRFALGWRVGRVDVALAQIHYSNGKSIFRWDHPNVGDNFITLQIGYVP
jgi:hypothetical protein